MEMENVKCKMENGATANVVADKFLDVFLKEWELYQRDGGSGTRDEKSVHWGERKGNAAELGEVPFDAEVKIGEIRMFAEVDRPMAGLILADQAEDGWLVVPMSEFTVPATEQEILIGERVYQLWNSFTAPREFAAKSWLVESIATVDLKHVAAALQHVLTGEPLAEDLAALTGLPITATDDPRLDYEKEFSAPESRRPKIAVERPNDFSWRRCVYSYAAGLAVLLGGYFLVWMPMNAPLGSPHRLPPAIPVQRPAENEAPELACDMAPPPEPAAELRREAVLCVKSAVAKPLKAREAEAPASAPPAPAAPRACAAMPASAPPAPAAPRAYASRASEPDTFARERYAEYVENEFVETKVQPLSTFGLDVDTASYTTMRRYLTDMKRLPPKDSVRLEEYVNYFKYNYPEPKDGTPVAVDCELAECPWNRAHKLLRVGLQAKRIAKDKLPPSNLVFLLDRSGSMDDNGGFNTLVKSMRLLVGQLRDEDSVAIVTYASDTKVQLPATKCSAKGKARILKVIDSLYADGYTSGGEGIQLAYAEAQKNFDKKANNRVILMTDGDFNVGVQSTQELVRMIEQKRKSGVFLSVFGVGFGNYRDEMVKKLANAGNGNYAYIDSLMEAKKVFMTEFSGTMYTVAKDVKLQLEFNSARTAAYRLLGYESRKLAAKDFNDDKKDAGEMGAGHNMTAFYELVPVGAATGVAKTDPLKYQKTTAVDSKELLTVKLRYKAPDGDTSKLVEAPVVAESIMRKGGPSEDFRFASAVAEFALVMEGSKFKGKASIKNLLKRARQAKGRDADGLRAEFIRLVEMAELYLSTK